MAKKYCQYCWVVCLQCPWNKNHEAICKKNPINIKKTSTAPKKVKEKQIVILDERKDKDLSRLDLHKINSPIYYDSNWNPFN